MDTSTAVRKAVVARIGACLVALAATSYAADHPRSLPDAAAFGLPTPTAGDVPAGAQCVGRPTHAFSVRSPDGQPLELTYVRGCGWKYVSSVSDGGETARAVGYGRLSPVSSSQAEPAAAQRDDPMALFIDGPTGYTYAWTRDAGWRFVGQIGGRDE
jgi:hypothetical protein